NGPDPHLEHPPSTVELDRLFANAQFSGDLFVQHARNDQLHHLKLSRRQQIKETPGLILLSAAPSLLGRSLQGVLDTLKQLISTKWLWKKIDRARFHCLRAHWDVAVASDKDELFFTAALDQFFLQIHPVHSRHLHIHDHARRAVVLWTRQEIRSRRENFAFVP